LSIRTRLTLWYVALLAVFLIVLGLSTYVVLSAALLGGIDTLLSTRADEIITASEGLLVGPGEFDIRLPQLDPFQKAGLYVQAWTVGGKLQMASENLREYPQQSLDPAGMPTQQKVARDVLLTGGTHLRVLTVPLAVAGETEVVGYLQIGTSLDMVDRAREALVRVLLPGTLLAVLISWFMGRFLAARALAPIDGITHTALQISRADDLGRRIEYQGPPDEVGRLAGAFNHMLARLELLFGAQQRVIADISHELRTPLTTVRANLDLIRRMGADDTSLDAIQGETERMTRLVGDLMLQAQLDAGELPIRHEPVQLDDLLLDLYRQARIIAGGQVEVVLGEEDQVCVLGDPDRLRQLLLNLVDNAIKYTPPGGRVTLGLSRAAGVARVTVRDTGGGIPPEELPLIFDRFYRVDKARSRPPTPPGPPAGGGEGGGEGRGSGRGGAGLGLSIAQSIAQAHGGSISVESTPGQGSTFTVTLPEAPNGRAPVL
jgi:two-component system OmpR family sensor kinase